MKKVKVLISIFSIIVLFFYVSSKENTREFLNYGEKNAVENSDTNKMEYSSWGIKALEIKKIQKEFRVLGEGVSVAVLDTGVSPNKTLNIKNGINIIDRSATYEDDNGHGTYLAGIISSIAPKVNLYAVKTLKADQSGSYEDIAKGIEWAIEEKVDIILMSFGGDEDSIGLRNAIEKAYSKDIILIASTGNTALSNNIITYPAKYKEVIAVGAITENNEAWIGSNTGKELTTMAPGHKILSILNDGTFSVKSGTSLAAAHVAGSLALCKSYKPLLNNMELKKLVSESSVTETAEGFNIFNLEEAFKVLKNI